MGGRYKQKRLNGGGPMITSHEQFDADRLSPNQATYYRSAMNRCEVPCHICGRPLYVGTSTKNEIERSIAHDLENPLTCSECERDFDERMR